MKGLYLKRLVSIPIVLLLIFLSFSATLAQTRDFKVSIDRIKNNRFPTLEVYCSVVDAQGFPVANLTSQDFAVTEDSLPLSGFSVAAHQNEGQPLAIVLAIDTSGSMGYGSKPTPIVNAVNAAKDFIARLSAQDQVAILSFSNEVTLIQDLTTDRSMINSALDSLTNKGATALNDAVMKAIDLLKNRSDRRAIILLTDGRPEGKNLFTADQVITEASQWAIPIYPVGFGQVDPVGLKRLAFVSGGAAQIKPDSQQLGDAFATILNIFRAQYRLEVTANAKPDNLEHELTVSANYQGGTSKASAKYIARTPIILTIEDPKSGATVHGRITPQIKVDALNPIQQVTFFVDDTALEPVLTAEPYQVEWDTAKFVTGEHTLKVVAQDTLSFTSEAVLPVIVELQRQDWLIWVIALIALVALAVVVPLALRRRRKTTGVDVAKEVKAGEAVLIELEGIAPNKVWALSNEVTRLGRLKEQNDIHLKGISASRSQAVIQKQGSQYLLTSRKRENPVILNGKPALQAELHDGDVLQLGESKFRFEVPGK